MSETTYISHNARVYAAVNGRAEKYAEELMEKVVETIDNGDARRSRNEITKDALEPIVREICKLKAAFMYTTAASIKNKRPES